MILRKPYAFIIRHFKLLHLILTALLGISIYRLSMISSFINEYLASPLVFNRFDASTYNTASNVSDLASKLNSLFPFYVFLIPLIIIIVTLIILFILYNKKKPYLLYIIIILYSLVLLAFYGISYNLINEMQTKLLDTRIVSLVKDLITISVIAGGVITALVLVRATGFDIKKFNFVKDLQDLDISEKDSEEFEVELNIDSNIIRRRIRKFIRNLKYFYVENRFFINLGLTIFVIITGFIVYFVIIVHHEDYEQNSTFSSDDFIMHIDNVYLTNKDYSGSIITDNYLVIIDLDIKSVYSNGKKLDVSNCVLVIGDSKYKHTSKYRDYIYDIGTVYDDNLIYSRSEKNIKRSDFKTNYLLVYEIPKEAINKKMIFRYTMNFDIFANSVRPKYARVKLNPINLDKNITTTEFDSEKSLDFKDSIIKNMTLSINSYEINEVIPEYYRFCISTNNCFDSVEYIIPSIGNYDKSVLKIVGNIKDSNITGVYDLYNFIDKFGMIEYQIGETNKKINKFNLINSNHSSNDTYYIEIPKEVESSSKVSLKFNIRNKIYEFILK